MVEGGCGSWFVVVFVEPGSFELSLVRRRLYEAGFVVVRALCVGETACVEAGSFVVVGAWFVGVEPRSSSSLRSWFVIVSEPCSFVVWSLVRSFVVVRVLVLALALLAASFVSFPWLPRRHVPTDGRRANGTQGSPLFFLFLFIWVCVCVCREASSVKVEIV